MENFIDPNVCLSLLYQDEHLVAVDKPCGMLVHPGKTPEPREYIAMKVLRDQLGQYVYPVHRLDRPTSGVLLFALHPSVEAAAKDLFATQQVEKEYYALVEGSTPEHWDSRLELAKDETEPLRDCHTQFKRLAEGACEAVDRPLTLVEARPLTGRMHQIRKHLAADGFPILGDYLYGTAERNMRYAEISGLTRLMLHSRRLALSHPVTGKPLHIESSVPEGFRL